MRINMLPSQLCAPENRIWSHFSIISKDRCFENTVPITIICNASLICFCLCVYIHAKLPVFT